MLSTSQPVGPEDIPEPVLSVLPGIEYLAELNLEGRAPTSAYARMERLAKQLAKAAHGVVENPQENSITAPAGVRRFLPPKRARLFSLLELSWWFLESPVLEPGGVEQLLRCLERTTPEALPRRYGLSEPPQHAYAEPGRTHFLEFLQQHLRDGIVWYPHRPVLGVHLGFPRPPGASRLGFRSNCIRISMEHAVLEQPGWNTQLRRAWLELSRLIRPFYGDVRVLDNYARGGLGGYSVGPTSEDHPVSSWWWRGLPSNLGNAVVLGETYQKLWPTFRADADRRDGLAVITSPDWSKKVDLAKQLGGVPGEIAQPLPERSDDPIAAVTQLRARTYPPTWPFGNPFTPE